MALKKITGRFNGNLGVQLGCLQPAANPGNRSSERPMVRGSPSHRLLLSPSLRRAVSPGRAPPEPELDPSPGTGSVPDGIAPQSHSDPTLGPRGLVGKRGKWGAKSEGRRRTVPSHAAVSKSALDLLNVL